MSLIIPFSEACERNKDPILETIQPLLEQSATVLEIGSGTGQHAGYFARNCPNLSWQPSDQAQYLEGLTAQFSNLNVANIEPPIELDVIRQPWIKGDKNFDLIYTANTLHIMSWPVVEAFFNGLATVTSGHSSLIIYGPFKFNGAFTSQSNAAFDQSLRSRGVGSGIRDFEEVNKLANQAGFELIANHDLPANNQCLVWQQTISNQTT